VGTEAELKARVRELLRQRAAAEGADFSLTRANEWLAQHWQRGMRRAAGCGIDQLDGRGKLGQ
jgi:hypothetical protein